MKTNPKVLMVAYVFPPFFSVGGSIRVVKFLKYLPSQGWHPVVLTIDDKKETASQRREGSESMLAEIPAEVEIIRTTSGETSAETLNKGRALRQKNKLAGVVINILSKLRQFVRRFFLIPDVHITWLPHAVKLGRQIIADKQIDVIFATCPPHSVALIGALLKKYTGKPLILDYRDDWIDTPWFRAKPAPQRWIERMLEKWAVSAADRVILVTEFSQDAFIKRYPGMSPEKFVFIPNGCDLSDYPDVSELKPERDPDHFTILHAGIVFEADTWNRNPRSFFTAIKNICTKHPDIAQRLRVHFTGQLKPGVVQMVKDMELSNQISELGYLSREDLTRQMISADLLLAINYEGFSTLIPGKIYEYWAAGHSPILLLSAMGAASGLIEQHRLGLTVDFMDVQGIENAILEIYRAQETGKPVRISREGIERYSRAYLTTRLAEVLAKVTGSEPNQDTADR
jgi:glycosyltransferase involved in cell wall biosynthesis